MPGDPGRSLTQAVQPGDPNKPEDPLGHSHQTSVDFAQGRRRDRLLARRRTDRGPDRAPNPPGGAAIRGRAAGSLAAYTQPLERPPGKDVDDRTPARGGRAVRRRLLAADHRPAIGGPARRPRRGDAWEDTVWADRRADGQVDWRQRRWGADSQQFGRAQRGRGVPQAGPLGRLQRSDHARPDGRHHAHGPPEEPRTSDALHA